ncbi:NADPH-dependent F420 reductase [Mameliella sediminis]|uniref:NADPH-dependent F420 reductase n=1 Tax=Mameliella sediminis TaxID=2836866 RepID=UPI001C48FEA9|nr:NAD(P)-binding domain-containing protein [Mameliella sediminis]MBV7395750.1 NAD(P)-binding domain-containing protein [Mameliella sediminis]MBY6115299.1 NAD(P)-binding domain-containing protein [Antarctobacter heliothermus]MBY6144636.1 NAD(P)-binding domain-containing protein [Mameliella alba]MCA0956108.1 NAD(P)-binding domain-containing protein [Mameliella alba]
MQIAIIGTGNVGSAIAHGLAATDHAVTLGARDPQSEKVLALAERTGARVATPANAAATADIIVLALPWAAAEKAVSSLGDLGDKIVIDCMNPLGMVDGALGLLAGHTTSGGEMVQGWLAGTRVVKTLNQVGAEIMADNADLPQRPVMFMAGDDDSAKAQVATVLNDLGFAPLDAGDLTKARLLEPFGMLWINQALQRGKGRNWAFAAVEG